MPQVNNSYSKKETSNLSVTSIIFLPMLAFFLILIPPLTLSSNKNETTGYLSEYVVIMPSLIFKEIVKKGVGRYSRSAIFTEDLQPVYPMIESTVFLRKNVAELTRNIYPLVKKNNVNNNYELSGKIIRNSFLGHILFLPIQIMIGHANALGFKELGLPSDSCQLTDIYSKQSSYISPFHEFSGRTAETLFLLEHQELQWLPIAINTGILLLHYNTAYADTNNLETKLKNLILSESIGSIATTGMILGLLSYDPNYEKYKIFNASINDIFDTETLKDILLYSIPVFASHITGTFSAISDILLVGMIDKKSLGTKKEFNQIALILNSFIAASAQASGIIVANSIANNESSLETQEKIYLGLGLSIATTAPYLIFLIKPDILASSLEEQRLVKISAFSNIIMGIEIAAKNELSAFKQESQSWFKTFSDITKTSIPIVAVIFFRTRLVEPNVTNYCKVQLATFLSTVFIILSLTDITMATNR